MQTLQEFLDFKNEILKENSRLYKQAVLRKYADNVNIKYYLHFIYNPYIVTGISTKKIVKDFDTHNNFSLFDETVFFGDVYKLLEYVKTHNTGTDTVLRGIKAFKKDFKLSSELCELLDSILTKTLTLGVDAKTINSVIPKLIPTFNVQLANKYFDNPKYVEGKTFALTTKIDGGRIIAKKKNGQVSFWTRAGQPYIGLVDLEHEFTEKLPDNFCMDGEITLINKGNLTSKEQYKETMKITRKDGEKHGIKMLVFDCMTADEFESQYCNRTYLERRKMLDELGPTVASCVYFETLPILYIGDDTSKIQEYLNTLTGAGEEGVMINICDAKYEFKRTSSLLKVKKMTDIDLRVIGFEEGEGKYAGRLGAILVSYKNNIVKVGSGLSDDMRRIIWNNQEKYLGKIMAIQYFEETTNADGGESLRFPVFLDFRDDKLIPDA